VEVEAYASAVGGGYAQGVGNVNASPRLLHVTATAAGQTGIILGVNNGPGSSAVLEHVSANASGGNFAYGVVSQPEAADRPVLRAVTANAFDGANFTIGVFTVGAGVTSLTDVVASATGATGTAAGLFHDTGTIALTGVTSTAAGSAPSRYGLVNNGGTTTTTVDRSTLTGPTASIQNGTGAIVRVAGSKLVGPATNSGTTMTCLFSYNGSFAALNVACQ
jgi:hypothetical protein